MVPGPREPATLWLCVKTEVDCPQNTDLRCPLFTEEIVQSVWSDGHIRGALPGFGDRSAAEEPGLLLLPEPITLAFDVECGRMMQEPIQDGGGQNWIVEDVASVGEAFITGHDQTAALIAPNQQSEE